MHVNRVHPSSPLLTFQPVEVLNTTHSYLRVMFASWLALGTSFSEPKLSVSIGQTVTQMPHPIQELFALVIGSSFKAKFMTSMPTWQLREHS